jgi:hypothetical protein
MIHNQKVLILSDVHTNIHSAERIITKEGADLNIFLGDYFDSFGDSPRDNGQAAMWVKQRLYKDNYIFLLGNHDVSYLTPSEFTTKCSGYSTGKQMAIDVHIGKSDTIGFKWFHWLNDDILLTHAGISNRWLQAFKVSTLDFKGWLTEQAKNASKAILEGNPHWFLSVGKSRGGLQPIGGPLWCDWETDFIPIPGYSQILGHTPGSYVRCRSFGTNSSNYCIDTDLNYYVVYLNGSMIVRSYSDV